MFIYFDNLPFDVHSNTELIKRLPATVAGRSRGNRGIHVEVGYAQFDLLLDPDVALFFGYPVRNQRLSLGNV